MDWNDMPDVEGIEVRGKKKKDDRSPEDMLKEDLYNRRCRLVTLSHIDYRKFMEYLLNNEDFFKKNLSSTDKEALRRNTCERAWTGNRIYSTLEDLEIFDRIFGQEVHPFKSKFIPVYNGDGTPREDPYKKRIDEQLVWFGGTPYHSWFEWCSNPATQELLIGRSDLVFKFKTIVDEQIRRNYNISRKQKEYDISDNALYEDIIRKMEKVI